MAEELRECPYCGHDRAEIISVVRNVDVVAVMCSRCDARGPVHRTDEAAIAAWNERAPVPVAAPPPSEPAPTPAVPPNVLELIARALTVADSRLNALERETGAERFIGHEERIARYVEAAVGLLRAIEAAKAGKP